MGAFIDHETLKTGRIFHPGPGPAWESKTFALPGDPYERYVVYPDTFSKVVGKRHGIYFSYFRYGFNEKKLAGFLRRMKRYGCAAQVAVEPTSLAQIQDDQTLHRLAAILKESEVPVFLRFASEMNGSWVPYSGDPALYREKFRLVARVIHKGAPNVAMVWCPSATPQAAIPKYFPGDDAVDWVGVNFYSVPGSSGSPSNPADSLDYVYRTYSNKHPIMICEWGASHRAASDDIERPDFAARQITRLYASLPTKYPRVKCVNWLSMNAIMFGNPGQRSHDYSLLDNEVVKRAYAKAVSDPYYLSDVAKS
ncbi:MAG: hypothetical protein JSS72_03730 [Armatimonadetes bacterium]|nr:hypothetical protein [Armatimonadota bacterium]